MRIVYRIRGQFGEWEAVFRSSNGERIGLYQWVSGSSTEAVDNPVENVFDNCVNVAVSLAFLSIAKNLGDIQAIDFTYIFRALSNHTGCGATILGPWIGAARGCDQFPWRRSISTPAEAESGKTSSFSTRIRAR